MYKRFLSLLLCGAVALTSLFVPIGEDLFTFTASAEAAQDAPADAPELSGDPFELYGGGRYYYYQLTEPQKAMYDMMASLSVNDLTIEDKIYDYSADKVDDDFYIAENAFMFDLIPDWCSYMGYSYYEAGDDVYLKITPEPCHFYNEYLDQELNRKIDLMLENLNSSYTTAQKVKAILMLISDNAEYDSLAVDLSNNIIVSDDSKRDYYAWSVYGTLVFSEGVCESYAKAFKKLANAMGIPCVLVQSGMHMYNYVMLDDGKWYMIDPTAETDPSRFLRGKNYTDEFDELYGSDANIYGECNLDGLTYPKVADKYYIAEGQVGRYSYDYIDVEIDTSIFAEEIDDTIEFTYTPNDNGTCTITGSRGGGELNIPSEIDGYTVTAIADSALEGLKNRGKLTIPDTVTKIGKNAFYGCINLEGPLVIPDSVTEIGDSAFRACGFDGTLKLSENLTEINKDVFKDCTSLITINIPGKVTAIHCGAFSGCSALKDVYYSGSKAQWSKITINGNNDELLSANINYNYNPNAPSSVTGLNIKGRSGDALRLAWDQNTSADGYIIERKDGTKWTRVVKITKNSTTEYRIAKLAAGTTYNFRVRAYKMDGKTALYSGYTTISASTKPSAVSGLKLKGRSGDALRLAWKKNTSADGYIIERKDGTKWTRVVKITKNTTTEYRISKLKAGTSYNFRICSYKIDGKTALYSGYTNITATTYPSAVSGLKLKNANSTAVRLSWTKNTNADGYIIEQKSGNKWVRVGKITKNSTVEFRKGSLKSKTSYTFRVTSYKIDGKTALYGAGKTITVKTK